MPCTPLSAKRSVVMHAESASIFRSDVSRKRETRTLSAVSATFLRILRRSVEGVPRASCRDISLQELLPSWIPSLPVFHKYCLWMTFVLLIMLLFCFSFFLVPIFTFFRERHTLSESPNHHLMFQIGFKAEARDNASRQTKSQDRFWTIWLRHHASKDHGEITVSPSK